MDDETNDIWEEFDPDAVSVEYGRNGMLLSMIFRQEYYKQLFQGYSKKEALALFKEYVLEEDSKIIRPKE